MCSLILSSNFVCFYDSINALGVCICASDPILFPFQDLWLLGAVGIIRHNVAGQCKLDVEITPCTEHTVENK